MKMRHLVVATSAALISVSAIAGGQQHSQSQQNTGTEASIVRDAQEKLRAEGYAATPQGLREFQQAKGLEPNGKLDQQTLAALGVDATAASGASSAPARQSGERPEY